MSGNSVGGNRIYTSERERESTSISYIAQEVGAMSIRGGHTQHQREENKNYIYDGEGHTESHKKVALGHLRSLFCFASYNYTQVLIYPVFFLFVAAHPEAILPRVPVTRAL